MGPNTSLDRPGRHGGSQGMHLLGLTSAPITDWQQLAVSTVWQGPWAPKPYRFYPHMGANAGLRQHGEKQEWSGLFGGRYLPAAWIPRAAHMARSNNGVTAKFNASTGNLAIPGVYVPSASINYYGGRATQ